MPLVAVDRDSDPGEGPRLGESAKDCQGSIPATGIETPRDLPPVPLQAPLPHDSPFPADLEIHALTEEPRGEREAQEAVSPEDTRYKGAADTPSVGAGMDPTSSMASVQIPRISSARRTKRTVSLTARDDPVGPTELSAPLSRLSQTPKAQGSEELHSAGTSPSEQGSSALGLLWSSSFGSVSTPCAKSQGSTGSPRSTGSAKKLGSTMQVLQPMTELWLDPCTHSRSVSATSASTSSTDKEASSKNDQVSKQEKGALASTGLPSTGLANEAGVSHPETQHRSEGTADGDSSSAVRANTDVHIEEAHDDARVAPKESTAAGEKSTGGSAEEAALSSAVAESHSRGQRDEVTQEIGQNVQEHPQPDGNSRDSQRAEKQVPGAGDKGVKGQGTGGQATGRSKAGQSRKKTGTAGKVAGQRKGGKAGQKKSASGGTTPKRSTSSGVKPARAAEAKTDSEALPHSQHSRSDMGIGSFHARNGRSKGAQGASNAKNGKAGTAQKKGAKGAGGVRRATSLPLTPRGTREPTGSNREGNLKSVSFREDITGSECPASSTTAGDQEGQRRAGAKKQRLSADETFFAPADSFESSEASDIAHAASTEGDSHPPKQGEIKPCTLVDKGEGKTKVGKRVSFKYVGDEAQEDVQEKALSLLPSAAKYRTLSRLLTKLHGQDTAGDEPAVPANSAVSPGGGASAGAAEVAAQLLHVSGSWETDDSEVNPVNHAGASACLFDYVAAASKEQLSQSVFEAQLYLAEQESIQRDQSNRSSGAKFLHKFKSVMNTEGLSSAGSRVVKIASVRLSAAKSSAKAFGKVLLSWRLKRNKQHKG